MRFDVGVSKSSNRGFQEECGSPGCETVPTG